MIKNWVIKKIQIIPCFIKTNMKPLRPYGGGERKDGKSKKI
jgi:hypothetical protein